MITYDYDHLGAREVAREGAAVGVDVEAHVDLLVRARDRRGPAFRFEMIMIC